MNAPVTTIWHDYDYAIVRVVPHVHLCTFLNIGVVLHSRTARFLESRFHLEHDRLALLCPDLDLALLYQYVSAYQSVCAGGAEAGPIGLLPPSERFHWLTAPRSVSLQTSEVHAGRTSDPTSSLEHIFTECVLRQYG
jgi:hypothetical protein